MSRLNRLEIKFYDNRQPANTTEPLFDISGSRLFQLEHMQLQDLVPWTPNEYKLVNDILPQR